MSGEISKGRKFLLKLVVMQNEIVDTLIEQRKNPKIAQNEREELSDRLEEERAKLENLTAKGIETNALYREIDDLEFNLIPMKGVDSVETNEIKQEIEEKTRKVKEIIANLPTTEKFDRAPSSMKSVEVKDEKTEQVSNHYLLLEFLEELKELESKVVVVEDSYIEAAENLNDFLEFRSRVEMKVQKEPYGSLQPDELMKYESVYSSYLCSMFCKLLEEKKISVIHQFPTGLSRSETKNEKEKDCCTDIVFLKSPFGELGMPIGVIEVKRSEDDISNAFAQAIGYLEHARRNFFDKDDCPVFMNAVITTKKIYPFLMRYYYDYERNPKFEWIKMEGAELNQPTYCGRYLRAFCNVLVKLQERNLETNKELPKIPLKLFRNDKYQQYDSSFGNNLAQYGETMCKVYDYYNRSPEVDVGQRRKPNLKIIKQIREDYIEGLKRYKFGKDVYLLTYKYMEGAHIPQSVKQLAQVCRDLHELHKKNYVHGDVRFFNIIFLSDKIGAKLIDFDFAGKVGKTYYPRGLVDQNTIKERHPDAKGGKEVEKDHDIHSMKVIVKTFVDITEDAIKDLSLDRLASKLESDLKLKNGCEENLLEMVNNFDNKATNSPQRDSGNNKRSGDRSRGTKRKRKIS